MLKAVHRWENDSASAGIPEIHCTMVGMQLSCSSSTYWLVLFHWRSPVAQQTLCNRAKLSHCTVKNVQQTHIHRSGVVSQTGSPSTPIAILAVKKTVFICSQAISPRRLECVVRKTTQPLHRHCEHHIVFSTVNISFEIHKASWVSTCKLRCYTDIWTETKSLPSFSYSDIVFPTHIVSAGRQPRTFKLQVPHLPSSSEGWASVKECMWFNRKGLQNWSA